MLFRLIHVLLSFALVYAVGCGGGSTLSMHEGFSEIQRHEAQLVRLSHETCQEDSPCLTGVARCAAVRGICQVAEVLDDADARYRCVQVRHWCPTEEF